MPPKQATTSRPQAKALMNCHLKAIETSLSMVEEEDSVPDWQQIWGRFSSSS
jgi:hypothetical protein|tara:strand:- start:2297 stop:2452 length:156 start_codon:yes stop_codon:yes gene_type:complete